MKFLRGIGRVAVDENLAKTFKKKLEAEIERLRLKRQRRFLRLREHIEEELIAADATKLRAASGTDERSRVTRGQRREDFWTAISDAIFARHEAYDVVKAYRRKLRDEVAVAKVRSRAGKMLRRLWKFGLDDEPPEEAPEAEGQRSDGEPITERDQLLAAIAGLQSRIELLKEADDVDEAAHETAFNLLIQKEEELHEPLFKEWHETLKRPAFFERVSEEAQAQAEAASRKAEETRESEGGRPSRPTLSMIERQLKSLRGIVDSVSQNAVTYAIPIEALFTYPAFRVLTPNNAPAAIAGSILFTGALAGAGICAALCYRRGFKSTVVVRPDGTKTIHRQASGSWLSFATIATLIGVVLVVGGADLRAKIPAMSDWLADHASLELRADTLQRHEAKAPNDPRVTAERSAYEADVTAHKERREKTLQFGSDTLHADEVVGWGVYAFLMIVGAVKVLISTDPIFEYHLLATTVRGNREVRLRLAAERDAWAAFQRFNLANATKELNDLRIRLWLIAPEDPLALAPQAPEGSPAAAPSTSADTASSPPEAMPPKEPAPATTSSESAETKPDETSDSDHKLPAYGEVWVRERLRNYVRAYMILRRKSLVKRWANSVASAMS